jgi:RNA polymerase sigma-70 factor (ECF subfamily)
VTDSTTPPSLSQGESGPDVLLAAYFARRANLVRFFAARAGAGTADDLTQELYLKIVSRPDTLTVQSPAALLYRMASNLLLDGARSARRSAVRETTWRDESRPRLGLEEVAVEPAADDAIIERQRIARLVEAVGDLPPQMGRAFRLHKLEGRSQAETAQAMGVSVKAIEKHIAAAMKALTAKLRP